MTYFLQILSASYKILYVLLFASPAVLALLRASLLRKLLLRLSLLLPLQHIPGLAASPVLPYRLSYFAAVCIVLFRRIDLGSLGLFLTILV